MKRAEEKLTKLREAVATVIDNAEDHRIHAYHAYLVSDDDYDALVGAFRMTKGQRTIWQNGNDVEAGEISTDQWVALSKIRERYDMTDNVEIMPGFDYIMVRVSDSLVLGIETDGHTHS